MIRFVLSSLPDAPYTHTRYSRARAMRGRKGIERVAHLWSAYGIPNPELYFATRRSLERCAPNGLHFALFNNLRWPSRGAKIEPIFEQAIGFLVSRWGRVR